ncbi:glycoside hydrolase [Lactifluus volemus]|nr:glycoside hydrolase [Lactifluus volemus]
MKILFALFILYAQLSNASHLPRSIIHSKRRPVALSWYASWHSNDCPLSSVSWSKYDSVIYAFAYTTPDVNTIGLQQSDQDLLPKFVQTAKSYNVRPILAIGGWGGSIYFSSAVATQENRTAFAQAIMRTVSQYRLEGIDFDWEYPGRQAIGCNVVSKDDSANFLSFLQILRSQEGAKDLIISAAVSITPFVGSNGQPMSDVSEFGKVLNNIEIMNYDIWGSWSSSVGPNAPLDDSCAPSPQGSAKSAVKAWTAAGFPQEKIILGVASYGHSYLIRPYVPFDRSQQPGGDKWDSTAGSIGVCGSSSDVGGVFDFWGLIQAGFLNKDGNPATGIDYTFDSCSQTPFVYNSKSQVMVSYDDARSFILKGNYIKDAGLAGFAMWQTGGDSHDILLNAIKAAFNIHKLPIH